MICRHLLIAFGGLAGLEECFEEDDHLKVWIFFLHLNILVGVHVYYGDLSFIISLAKFHKRLTFPHKSLLQTLTDTHNVLSKFKTLHGWLILHAVMKWECISP